MHHACDGAFSFLCRWGDKENRLLHHTFVRLARGIIELFRVNKIWLKKEGYCAIITNRLRAIQRTQRKKVRSLPEKKSKAYVADDARLISEWNWNKNTELGLNPHETPCCSAKKVWWKCEKGHEWLAKVANRKYGCNCPICSGKQVAVGWNDLASLYPHLATEWHPTNNGELTPKDITAGSNKRVWWLCSRGHEWQDTVAHRSSGRGCPRCSGELKTSFPEQAVFFYFQKMTVTYNRYLLDPKTEIDIYLPQYKIGIEYDGAYFHKSEKAEQRETRKQNKLNEMGITLIRVREFEGRPYEYAIQVKQGANDKELSEAIQKLLALVTRLTHYSFEIDVDVGRDRYDIYEQYIQNEKENSLAVLNSTLAAEWHPIKNGTLLPEHFRVSSNKKVWWKCNQGHEWEAAINSRSQGHGCPFCAGLKVLRGVNDLATQHGAIAKQWHPTKNGFLTAFDVTSQSNKPVWWQCEKGHEWLVSPSHRIRGNGCPVCSGHRVLAGYNDLATVNPFLAAQWHPTRNGELKPSDVTRGSKKKVWWLCENGHEWEAVISSRHAGRGCPDCARKRRGKK